MQEVNVKREVKAKPAATNILIVLFIGKLYFIFTLISYIFSLAVSFYEYLSFFF